MLKLGQRVRGKDKYGRVLEGYVDDVDITYSVVWDTDEKFQPKQYKSSDSSGTLHNTVYQEWGFQEEDLTPIGSTKGEK